MKSNEMEHIELRIKNMVCLRCIKVVKQDMEQLGLQVENIQLGKVTVTMPVGQIDMAAVKDILRSEGFELLEDRQANLVENIKITIINLIYSGTIENVHIKFSDYLSGALNKEYHYLSTAFSASERITLEKYFILQKIERAKELLSYNELSLSEISRKLAYSSIAHFSNQFRQIVGISPTQYRKTSASQRNFIDQLK